MLWCWLFAVFSVAASATVRLCVPENLEEYCIQMAKDVPDSISCVIAKDVVACNEKISRGEADVLNADPRAIYLGGKNLGLVPVLTELSDGEPYRYRGIALVSKESDIQSARDLKGKTSCHTGLGRTVGWKIPVSMLLARGVAAPDCERGELGVVQNFFGGSCVPGIWSTDQIVEERLKTNFSSLCSRCKNPSACAVVDEYAGYEGVMRCISDGNADVAFTKIPALKEYLQKNPEFADKVDILCFDGGRNDVNDENPCVWGERPTNAYIASTDKTPDELSAIRETLLSLQGQHSEKSWYYKTFLSGPHISGLRETRGDRIHYRSYLGDFLHAVKFPRPGCDVDEVRLCVTSIEALQECQDYSFAVEAMDLRPDLRCITAASKPACMELLKEGHVHLLVLDGGDVYKGGRYYGLQPVAGEIYNGSDATYYSVAVLRSASDVNSLPDLRGERSCHTGLGRTAGWVMPIGALRSAELLKCGGPADVADFFSAGSCVPGANDTKYNPQRIRSEDLCRHCIGDQEGNHKCARDSTERYSGYGGALRCLAEGRGDVAFVKHTTINDYVNGHNTADWAKDLLSSDFKLLCAKGGNAAYNHYLECNLGKVPSHYVMTGGNTTSMQRCKLGKLLADSSRFFGKDATLFQLFRRNQLFAVATTGLKVAPFSDTYEDVLGPEFLAASAAVDPLNVCVR